MHVAASRQLRAVLMTGRCGEGLDLEPQPARHGHRWPVSARTLIVVLLPRAFGILPGQLGMPHQPGWSDMRMSRKAQQPVPSPLDVWRSKTSSPASAGSSEMLPVAGRHCCCGCLRGFTRPAPLDQAASMAPALLLPTLPSGASLVSGVEVCQGLSIVRWESSPQQHQSMTH